MTTQQCAPHELEIQPEEKAAGWHLRKESSRRYVSYGMHPMVCILWYRKSTWPMSRNHLSRLGHQWEQEQNWRFEYFVFFDEDVLLAYRTREIPQGVVVDFANYFANDELTMQQCAHARTRASRRSLARIGL